METVMTVFGIVFILFAMVGIIALFGMLGAMMLIKRGAMLTFGYEQDDTDEQ